METQYLGIAMQYYLAGRSAAMAALMPVCGNLFHHAVEMFLKYILVRAGYSQVQLRNYFRHHLKKLWREFKKIQNDPSLARFDKLISGLDKVDELRYPGKGYSFAIEFRKNDKTRASGPGMKGLHLYRFNLEQLDDLVTTLLTGRVTAGWIRILLKNKRAMAQYEEANLHSFLGG
jgi:hypothetical protein